MTRCLLAFFCAASTAAAAEPIRVGIIGLDTSHAPAFTKVLNDANAAPDVDGVRGVETLFTVMGPDCQTVVRMSTAGMDVVVGTWADGRIGTFRGLRAGKPGYGGTAFGEKGTEALGVSAGYRPLVVQIVRFF